MPTGYPVSALLSDMLNQLALKEGLPYKWRPFKSASLKERAAISWGDNIMVGFFILQTNCTLTHHFTKVYVLDKAVVKLECYIETLIIYRGQ